MEACVSFNLILLNFILGNLEQNSKGQNIIKSVRDISASLETLPKDSADSGSF